MENTGISTALGFDSQQRYIAVYKEKGILNLRCKDGDLRISSQLVSSSQVDSYIELNTTMEHLWLTIVKCLHSQDLYISSGNNQTNPKSVYNKSVNYFTQNAITLKDNVFLESQNSCLCNRYNESTAADDLSMDCLTQKERSIVSKGDKHVKECLDCDDDPSYDDLNIMSEIDSISLTSDSEIKDDKVAEQTSNEGLKLEIISDNEENHTQNEGHAVDDDSLDAKRSGDSHAKLVHTCEYCDRAFSSYHRLKVHLHTHSLNKPFKCTGHCDKSFGSKAQLVRHILSYRGTRNHNCVFCRKAFATKEDLNSHLVVHSTIKPFQCSYCGKTFARSSQLNRHNLTHTGERRYQCSYCGKSFSTMDALKQHTYIHTGIRPRPYICTICNKSFIKSSHLTRHYTSNSHLQM